MIPAIFRARATMAVVARAFFAIFCAQRTIGSVGRDRYAAQAAWTRSHRIFLEPAFVREVRRFVLELDRSPGVIPKYDSSSCAFRNRPTSSTAARNRIEVT